VTLYRVTFKAYDGTAFRLDTIDEAKIGPWLAEMFGLYPYLASAATSVDIQAVERFR
jgi:hypothetical protein